MVDSVSTERRFTESFPDCVERKERQRLFRVYIHWRRLFLEPSDAVLYIHGFGSRS